MADVTFVVLDLETSGATPESGAAITEIGALKIRGGQVIGEFQSFVNPGHVLPEFITALTGINDEMLEEAPNIAELLPSFFEFLGSAHESVLVAHNAPFDISFLKAATLVSQMQWPNFTIVDTVSLARSVLDRDEVPNCKLSTLAPFFGATTTPNHRALDDARATVDVLHGLFERLGPFGITTIEELRTFKRRRPRRALD